MKMVCKKNQCAGCMACLAVCSKNAIRIEKKIEAYNAIIDEKKCVECGECQRVCQQKKFHDLKEPIMWKQGWTCDDEMRKNSASGGIAAALAQAFVKSGGKVCSCVFWEGQFDFDIIENINDLYRFSGSKYIKSNPEKAYKAVKRELVKGNNMLFIGLPCQVAAIKKYVGRIYEEKLITIDLICHGTPSPQILDLYLRQYGEDINKMKMIDFRVKGNYQVANNSGTIVTKGVCDRYMLAFLKALCYTENCYSCKYAQIKRSGDITLGDSWGTDLEKEEWKKGISLILCQSEKGMELLQKANIKVVDVNVQNAIQHNHQLNEPCKAPKTRKQFIKNIENGKNFNNAVLLALPKDCVKQMVKELLIKFGLITPGGSN